MHGARPVEAHDVGKAARSVEPGRVPGVSARSKIIVEVGVQIRVHECGCPNDPTHAPRSTRSTINHHKHTRSHALTRSGSLAAFAPTMHSTHAANDTIAGARCMIVGWIVHDRRLDRA